MSPRGPMIAPEDGSVLWRFFDSVSTAIASRMTHGSTPGEENLTFLLCELLDESSTAMHVLDYPLSKAKAVIEASDSGASVEIVFTTHEHSKHVESKYSGADLGIVFSVIDPILGNSRRAALVQAKRLFAQGCSREFSLASGYESFHHEQRDFLKLVQERFGVHNSVFYAWYNPTTIALPEHDAKRVRAYEVRTGSLWQFSGLRGRFHPMLDELLDWGLSVGAGFSDDQLSKDAEESKRKWRANQPAVRISGLDAVVNITKGNGTPTLGALYAAAIRDQHRLSSPIFAPLADFFLCGCSSDRLGASENDWVRLAEGNKVPLPASRSSGSSNVEISVPNMVPAPKHTLSVTLHNGPIEG